jgi:hypothetical protein
MIITTRFIQKENILRKELTYATEWMANLLMGPRLPPKLDLHFEFKEMEHLGLCSVEDCESYPRSFLIEIKKGMCRKEILGSIAHELVHVKQFARRELVSFCPSKNPKYLGKEVKGDICYWDQPWEIEAFGREIGLVTRYEEHLLSNLKLKKSFLRRKVAADGWDSEYDGYVLDIGSL